MHLKNIHNRDYDFGALTREVPELKIHLKSIQGKDTIDFSDPQAVFLLNKALLLHHYNIKDWEIPEGYLCPAIPGRIDYLHYLADLLKKPNPKGLDIGTGSSLIYPLLAASHFGWKMKGIEVDETAFAKAKKNLSHNPHLKKQIKVILQPNRAHILHGIIAPEEYYDFTMCNPPFFSSTEEALKANQKKNKNLRLKSPIRNFAGAATELYCNGGEALFVKRMIKESVVFQKQVGWFTTLISKSEHLKKLLKQLDKVNATYQTIEMEQGNKKSRILAWRFDT